VCFITFYQKFFCVFFLCDLYFISTTDSSTFLQYFFWFCPSTVTVLLPSRCHPVTFLASVTHHPSPLLQRFSPSMTVHDRLCPLLTVFTALNRFYSLSSVLIDLRTINNPLLSLLFTWIIIWIQVVNNIKNGR